MDQRLFEALVTVRIHSTQLQGSHEADEDAAAQEVAGMETKRDTATREAAYAKAKLAS